MTRPMLMATGSKDPGRTGKPWQWRLEPFLNSPPEDKYALYIEGVYHGFGGVVESGLPTEGPVDAEIATYTKAVTTMFWDAYLKDDSAAMQFLSKDKVEKVTAGNAIVLHRGEDEARIAQLGRPSPGYGGGRQGRGPRQGGMLSTDEIIDQFDRDGDGSLSESEMPPRLAPAFNSLDNDGDGEVSAEELETLQQRRR